MRWGLIPMGRTNARGRPVLETIVNARSETLFAKSAYAGLGRCLLPVSGWYEWTGERRRKTRWAIRAPGRPILAFAAVWDLWRAPGGAEVASLATVTCAPNAEVAVVHDRMPVILGPDAWAVWLGEAAGEPAALMRPLPAGELVVEPAAED
jgi:putative SOS response-associated peptidase YedK